MSRSKAGHSRQDVLHHLDQRPVIFRPFKAIHLGESFSKAQKRTTGHCDPTTLPHCLQKRTSCLLLTPLSKQDPYSPFPTGDFCSLERAFPSLEGLYLTFMPDWNKWGSKDVGYLDSSSTM
ncbi:hypothetical protein AVEN_123981-1 [Araneus ventricosus]|uniref:Uncharacterized protein n=1 Tax=Araneus ventricosus TaxID=182803 RepID=A0A4Y2DBV8_ARAVE|nr:hypothetical protein AVEN_123981-1 [Araneus ventricosus]